MRTATGPVPLRPVQVVSCIGWVISALAIAALPLGAQDCAFHVPVDGTLTSVSNIIELSDSRVLVSGLQGLHELRGGYLVRITADKVLREVNSVVELSNGQVLVAANQGLFLLHNGRLANVPSDVEAREVRAIGELPSGRVLVGSERGLFEFKNGKLVATLVDDVTHGSITDFVILKDGQVLVVGSGMVARLTANGLKRVSDAPATLSSYGVVEQSSGRTFLRGTIGLQVLRGGQFLPLQEDRFVGAVWNVTELSNGRILVGSTEGLFHLLGGRLSPILPRGQTGEVEQISEGPTGQVLVGTERGLFRLKARKLLPLQSEAETRRVLVVAQVADGRVLVGTQLGLFCLEGDRLIRVPADRDTGVVWRISELTDGRVFAFGQYGLLQIERDRLESASVRYQDIGVQSTALKTEFSLAVSIEHRCARAIGSFQPRLVVQGREQPLPYSEAIPTEATTETVVRFHVPPFEQKGTFCAQLQLRDGTSAKYVDVGNPYSIRVDWGFVDLLKSRGWIITVLLAVLHLGVFLPLLLCAPFKPKCFSVLTSAGWGKLGFYTWLLIRFSRAAQLWLFAGYYKAVQDSLASEPDPYCPVPLTAEDGMQYGATQVLRLLGCQPRLWVQGNAGMGKTVFVRRLLREYFEPHGSKGISPKFREHGYVPVFVNLREYADLPVPESRRQDWVIEAARAALEERGFVFEDSALLRVLVADGLFAIIMDGLNETERGEEVVQASRRMPNLRILVTSQDLSRGFTVLRLPPDIKAFADQLLVLYLGEQRGKATYQQIAGTGLLDEVQSGYDIRLVADLSADLENLDQLPVSRLHLYQTIMSRVRLADGRTFDDAALCRMAWDLWRAGNRRIRAGQDLTTSQVGQLRSTEAAVLSAVGGGTYEFRHDQMRAFLAARWVVSHSASIGGMLKWLDDDGIWALGRTDQEEMWNFLAQMVAGERGLEAAEEVWKFATDKVERALLQHALQREAQARGWAFMRPNS